MGRGAGPGASAGSRATGVPRRARRVWGDTLETRRSALESLAIARESVCVVMTDVRAAATRHTGPTPRRATGDATRTSRL